MAKAFIVFLYAFLAFAQTAQSASPAEQLKIGMSQFPSSLHPYYDEMVAKSLVLGAALRPMTAHDASWNPVCLLCTELPNYENGRAKKETRADGGKGIAATYTLKDNLFWDDGTPLTSGDIVFAWQVGRHPQSGIDNAEFFAKDIVDITVDDDKNFTIHFDKEKCEFAAINDFHPLPAHLERKIFEEDPATYKNRTLYNTAPTTPGLYTGPYKIAKVEQGAAVTLDKNPQWKGTAGAFDTVTFRTIENTAALSSNLLSGDIDYIAGELGLPLDQAIAFEKRLSAAKPGGFDISYKPGLTYEHIDLNLGVETFQDVRVRQALLYAIDREAINNSIFDGRQPVAATDINPLDTVYVDTVKKYAYDPEKAAELLEAAGWRLQDDGFRYNGKLEKLTVVLSTTAGNQSREMIQLAIKSDWEKAGISTVIANEPARVLFGDTMKERKFKGGVMYAWMSSPRNIPKTTLHSSMIPSAANNYAGQNYAGYGSLTMDKIIDDLDVVCEPSRNLWLWGDLQRLYAEELPALPLYYRADSFFVPRWLKGIVPTGHQYPTTLWIENWSITE